MVEELDGEITNLATNTLKTHQWNNSYKEPLDDRRRPQASEG